MRTVSVPVFRLLVCLVMIVQCASGFCQKLSETVDYSVKQACRNILDGKPAIQDRYFIQLDVTSLPGPDQGFEIIYNGTSLVQFNVDISDLPYTRVVGPLPIQGGNSTFHDLVFRSLDTGIADTLKISEVVCGYGTNNGANRAGYFCSADGHGMIAQTAPDILTSDIEPSRAYVYVLTEKATEIVQDVNGSGLFKNLQDLTEYQIHAFAVPYESVSDVLLDLPIGQVLDQTKSSICFALCGVFPTIIDCSSFDLDLTKDIVNGPMFEIGDTVDYKIIVHNAGIVTAYDVQIQDHIPAEMDYILSLNPGWSPNGISPTLDSLEAGDYYAFEIALIIKENTLGVTINNEAEIIFAGDEPDDITPAYDIDSTPDNDEDEEDDQDEEDIIVFENFCTATLELDFVVQPTCAGQPFSLIPVMKKANYPVIYTWTLPNGTTSNDSVLTIYNHSTIDYGMYQLFVQDALGCPATVTRNAQPISSDNFACISNLNLSVSQNCSLNLDASLFTTEDVPTIQDYILQVSDRHGLAVDLNDLSSVQDDPFLEVRIINPCTGQTVCWTNVNLEFKVAPQHNEYRDTLFTNCAEIPIGSATDIINEYNRINSNEILSPEAFTDFLLDQYCIANWIVSAVDHYLQPYDPCIDNQIARVYLASYEGRTVALDTAILSIEKLNIDSLHFPEDLSNLTCDSPLSPNELGSVPFYIVGDDSISLLFNSQIIGGAAIQEFCNLTINYTDQTLGELCAFGAQKILRSWSALDWCLGKSVLAEQFLFRMDKTPPVLSVFLDTLNILTDQYQCKTDVNLAPYFSASDICDPNPQVFIEQDGIKFPDLQMDDLQVGIHELTVVGLDACNNRVDTNIVLKVMDNTPPVAVVIENLVLSYDGTFENGVVNVTALSIDEGSHDSGCGPVSIVVAREDHIEILTSYGGSLSLSDGQAICGMSDSQDENNDDHISIDELYQAQIKICCEDVGLNVAISVRVEDQWGNTAYASTWVNVTPSASNQSCDDGNVCTVNDVQIGKCPCRGTVVTSDLDNDGIIDCEDDRLEMCLDGSTIIVAFEDIQSQLDQGAVGGACDAQSVATISGTIKTIINDPVQYVMVQKNQEDSLYTGFDGVYAFENVAMYSDYDLIPFRNDNPYNGVTALDLVVVKEHLLGLKTFGDPYRIIAADANNDGRVGVIDLLEIQKLILGLTDGFSNNYSWRFVTEDYEFSNTQDPFPYTEMNQIKNLDRNMLSENWIGIKVGDVTNDAIPNDIKSNQKRQEATILSIADRYVNKDEEVTVGMNLSNQKMLYALQFGLKLGNMDFLSISSANLKVDASNVASHQGDNSASFVWYNEDGVTTSDLLFNITLRANESGSLSDFLTLGNIKTPALIYVNDRVEEQLKLTYTQSVVDELTGSEFRLHQNHPNPFNGETLIAFELPESGLVKLKCYNVTGELIYSFEDELESGLNDFTLKESDLSGAAGLIYYQIEFGGQSLTRSMIVSKR